MRFLQLGFAACNILKTNIQRAHLLLNIVDAGRHCAIGIFKQGNIYCDFGSLRITSVSATGHYADCAATKGCKHTGRDQADPARS